MSSLRGHVPGPRTLDQPWEQRLQRLLPRLPRPEPLSTRGLAQHAELGARLSLPGLCDTPSPLGHTNSSRSAHHELTSAPEQAPRLHGVHVLGERALS